MCAGEDASTWDHNTVPSGTNALVIVNASTGTTGTRDVDVRTKIRLLGSTARVWLVCCLGGLLLCVSHSLLSSTSCIVR